jgi:hypothetical protein
MLGIHFIDVKIIDIKSIGPYGLLMTPFAGSGGPVQALCEAASNGKKAMNGKEQACHPTTRN